MTKTYKIDENFTPPHGESAGFPVAVSIIDGSYIGTIEFAENLHNRGIVAQAIEGNHVASIGFCEKEQKWYGWSHRAIYGFAVGSEVRKGDNAYMPVDEESFREKYLQFFGVNKYHKNASVRDHTDKDGTRGALITATYTDDVPNEKLRGTEYICFWPYRYEKFGRGEWVAKTLEDARQMASDFAEGVA